jgi:hypothetical protein
MTNGHHTPQNSHCDRTARLLYQRASSAGSGRKAGTTTKNAYGRHDRPLHRADDARMSPERFACGRKKARAERRRCRGRRAQGDCGIRVLTRMASPGRVAAAA